MYLTRELIKVEEFLADRQRHDVINFKSGASVLFLGICRDHSDGRVVTHLEYEAYEDMAERMVAHLVGSAKDKWPVHQVRLLHRLGVVNLGEIAVAIDVRAAHRNQAYEASRFLIDCIKHDVPIWKKEFFTDGTSEWSLCQHAEFQRSTR